jgi:hypothetical protein
MAKVSFEIIQLLRNTADEIEKSHQYEWGHMGACNCGFLAQQVTRLSKKEIHQRALQRYGDWNEQLHDYCPTSGLLFDDVITNLLNAGFDIDDLKHLERLSHPLVLGQSKDTIYRHNSKQDVVKYIKMWAAILENQLLESIKLPESQGEPVLQS